MASAPEPIAIGGTRGAGGGGPHVTRGVAAIDDQLDRPRSTPRSSAPLRSTASSPPPRRRSGRLTEAGIRDARTARPPTGTITDAVVLAWTGRGPRVPYLGPDRGRLVPRARACARRSSEGILRR